MLPPKPTTRETGQAKPPRFRSVPFLFAARLQRGNLHQRETLQYLPHFRTVLVGGLVPSAPIMPDGIKMNDEEQPRNSRLFSFAD
jgi:hypothetical protein